MCKIESWTLTTKKVLEIGKLINYKMWLVTIHVNLVTILIEGPVPSNVLQKSNGDSKIRFGAGTLVIQPWKKNVNNKHPAGIWNSPRYSASTLLINVC